MSLLRRRSAIAGLSSLPLAGLPHVAARAQAADFPDRPLRFIVGFPPGGPNDVIARIQKAEDPRTIQASFEDAVEAFAEK